MDNINRFSTDQWIHQYPYTPIIQQGGDQELCDATTVPVAGDSSQGTTGGQASPKPIRRRSRASRRTPTTVLNASPTDFRALVQRFTGCDSKESMDSAVNLPKGPVNIDFARNNVSETSSRYEYFNNQVIQSEQMLSVGGVSGLQAGYGMENSSVNYESVDESSLMETRRASGSHGYN